MPVLNNSINNNSLKALREEKVLPELTHRAVNGAQKEKVHYQFISR